MCYYNYLAFPCCRRRRPSEVDNRGREFDWVRFYFCYDNLPEVFLRRMKLEGKVIGVENCPYGEWYNDWWDYMDYELLVGEEANCPWCFPSDTDEDEGF
ncbi:hypothetical protein H2201_005965 [Coniosporium apollinis]|uniref:Uncharacterized protein n=1 Tax=Coniosporium apollinis TaxID=61459 RepID=A0ABQ9NNB7_9PEZI|nr:hypothetical protein H2201_005965 [Coniosporium apollinis]